MSSVSVEGVLKISQLVLGLAASGVQVMGLVQVAHAALGKMIDEGRDVTDAELDEITGRLVSRQGRIDKA
jgi:hypothetical protein